MCAQALRVDIERGLGIDLGQTIAHKVGRNHPTRKCLGDGSTAHVVEEQVVRPCATAVVLAQDIAQGYLNCIGKEVCLSPMRASSLAAIPCGAETLISKNPMIGSVEILTATLPRCQTSMPSKLVEVSDA